MPYCVVYGCNSNSQCDKNIYWFTFPKDSQRNRAWVHYCKRQDFTPSKHSRICSKHFTLNQYSRHPERLSELGYPGAKAALKDDAMPDIPVVVDAEKGPSSPKKPRSAFEKRQKRQVLQEAFNESLDKSVDSIDTETESPPAPDSMEIQEEVEIPVDIPKTFVSKSFNTDYTNMKIQKNQTDPIPQRTSTRRNQTLKPKRKSKGIQCNPSDIDSASKVATSKTRTIIGKITSSSLAPAATEQNKDDNDEIDDDEDDVDAYDNDPDYIYNESEEEDGDDEYGSDDEEETSNYRMEECNDPVEENYYQYVESVTIDAFQLLNSVEGQ
ncbi:transcription initiation factor TFIID subunit 11-like [Mytilus trossulus]|uniref:transcription initiation factor TFIID subunit 11-like n=1 Tax=Mytilus trossulus TaxID=6551 RepID=UPI003007A522